MTEKEAIIWVESMRLKDNDTTNCAVDLCVHDIETHGLRDWLKWDPIDIAKIFAGMCEDSVTHIIDEIESQRAGEALIDEMLGGQQHDSIDVFKESKKLAIASVRMLQVLTKYHSIHEFIKSQDEEDNTY